MAKWMYEKVSSLFDFLGNNTLSRSALTHRGGEVKNVHYGDVLIKFGDILDFSKDEVPFIKAEYLTKKLLAGDFLINGDIIIADTAEDESVGKVCEVYGLQNEERVLSGLHTYLLRQSQMKFAPKFLGYLMNSPFCHNQLLPYIQGIKVSSISKKAIGEMFIPVPPLAEQNAIAAVLSDADSLIMSLERLIEKKKLIRLGAMQELLTGRKRLEGFSGVWEKILVRDAFVFLHNNTLSRSALTYSGGEVKNVHYGDVLIKFGDVLDFSKDEVPFIKAGYLTKKLLVGDFLQDGDIIMADVAEDTTAGKACEVINLADIRALAGMDTFLLRPQGKLFAPKFMGYYMNTSEYHDQLVPYMYGTKVCHLPPRAVLESVVPIPSFIEQSAIAAVLSDMDAEISALEAKADKYRKIKQGMMSELLTGRVRLADFNDDINAALAEADAEAASGAPRMTHEEVFGDLREKFL